jgi:hypothetical protein
MAKKATRSPGADGNPGNPANPGKAAAASVVALTDAFCRERLNEEYAALCRKLAEALGRKRPSPLVRGRVEIWACAVVRVIGWVNFLDDRDTSPHSSSL